MKTIGIKDLQINPATLTKALEKDEYTMITKRSKPIGFAISFHDEIITEGLKTALMVDAYKNGYLSLGQVAKALDLDKRKAMKLLSSMGLDVVEYDFEDDMKEIENLL